MLEAERTTKPFYRTWWGILFLFPISFSVIIWKSQRLGTVVKIITLGIFWIFVLTVYGAFSSPDTVDKNFNEGAERARKVIGERSDADTLTMMDKLWIAVDKGIGSREGIDIEYQSQRENVWLKYSSDNFWDENATVREAYKKLVQYGTAIFELDGVKSLRVTIQGPFIDGYGNADMSEAVVIEMSKEEFMKFNWEVLEYTPVSRQIEAASSYYHIHPSIQANLDEEGLYLKY